MEAIDFLRRVTGTVGWYCVLALGPTKGRRTQKFYQTAEAALHAAVQFDALGRDSYFALGRFGDDESREAVNVTEMAALFLDVDCGPEKDYPTQVDGLQALRRFVRRTGLPRPLVVNSGRGLHAYWPLSAPVPAATWLPVAMRLKRACATLDMRCDRTATADAARVLRLPGTHNHKDDPPRPVSILLEGDASLSLEELDELLVPHAPAGSVASASLFEAARATIARPEVQDAARSAMQALQGNFESSFRKLARKTAAGKGCNQIAQMLTDPASVPEPIWRAGLSIAACCTEPEAIHWISRGHPDYDPEETERKARRTKGPYLCASFKDLNAEGCADCPLWGKIKSPIVLGKVLLTSDDVEAPEEPVVRPAPTRAAPGPDEIPTYPKPYVRGAKGGVYMQFRDETGELDSKLVWDTDLYVVRRMTDPEQGEVVEMRYHLPHDGVRNFVVPLTHVTSKEDFRKALATQGVAAINKEVDALMTYTQAWVRELQQSTAANNAHRQFGWISDFSGFVLGSEVLYPDRIEYNASSVATRSLIDHFTPKGTLEGWKKAMDFYNRPGFELHQFVVCAGFGSILMKFMPLNATLLHLWSKDSGFGKTTAQYAALSVWGNPTKLIMGERDTYNSKMNRAEVMHSLPICMDELTNMRPTDASDLIYQVTGGQQRNRLHSNGNTERYRGSPWNLLFVSSANCSLIEKVATAKAMPRAEAQRVLEIEVDRLFKAPSDKLATDAFSKALQENYGHAGRLFVAYVLRNLSQVDTLVTTVQRQIDRAADLGPENRFWSAAAAVAVTSAVICNHLGLLPYDVKNLRDYVVKEVLKKNQTVTAREFSQDTMGLIMQYAYENWGKILQISSLADQRGRHLHKNLEIIEPEHMPRAGEMVGRYETDLHKLYLIIGPFRNWLSKNQMSFNSVEAELVRRRRGVRKRSRLTRGTTMNLNPVEVLEITMELEGPDFVPPEDDE